MATKQPAGSNRVECRLVYRSDTSWDLLSNQSLQELAAKSARKNKSKEITGLLILSGEHFLQVLEGPAEAVNPLFHEIIKDKRHTNVTLLSYEQISRRHFADWSMHVVDLYELPLEERKFLTSKYQMEDGFIRIPDDDRLAFALLLDARAVAIPETERQWNMD